MKKRITFGIIGLLLIVGLYFGVKTIRQDHYPLPIKPSETWEPFVNSLEVGREAFFVESDGINLEAELFIPNGGQEQKPAVVFSPGSGDALYQNYAWGFIETYVLDVFLSHDIAVLLVNKRGMGQSEGNYVKNSIEGRAGDIYAAVESIKNHPSIDAEDIGLVGHSQGGWVVVQAAAEHPDIAFFISLAGPTTTMLENAADNSYYDGLCQGIQGEELDAYIADQLRMVNLGISIGELTNFGQFGFDARNMGYDPRKALLTYRNPGLFVYAENDNMVTPALNIERMEEIFDGNVPANLKLVVIDGATHAFRLVDDPCEYLEYPEEQEKSRQLSEVLHSWLADQGY
jgi:pimeloyl-ACP methyl ester carboxylesterase